MMATSSKYRLRSTTSFLKSQVFENELILELVLQNFGLGHSPSSLPSEEDLERCRLISQKWKRASTKCLRKFNTATRKFLKLPGEKFLEYIATFSSYDSPGEHAVFTCYNLEFNYPYLEYLSEDLTEAFFLMFAQRITSVTFTAFLSPKMMDHLHNYLSTQSKSLQELKLFIPRHEKQGERTPLDYSTFNFPPAAAQENSDPISADYQLINLTHLCLTLQLDHIHPGEVTHQHNILEHLLNKIPQRKLKDLKLYLLQWEGIEKTIPILKKFNQIKTVKVLDMKNVRPGVMKSLSDLGPQFRPQFLVIDYSSQPVTMRPDLAQEVYDYLCDRGNMSSSSLEMLDWGSYLFKFPRVMPALKKLRLRWGNGDDMLQEAMEWLDQQLAGNNVPAIHPQINYGQMFPVLEELEFHCANLMLRTTVVFTNRFLQPQLPCMTLRKLVIGFCKINVLHAMSLTFPRVTSLKIMHDKKEMSDSEDERKYFIDLWSDHNFSANLEELHIETSFASQGNRDQYEWDSIFSGVDEEKIGSICNSMKFEDFKHSDTELRSSILNLKNLKKLSISNTYRYELKDCDCSFTNFSAFCIFGRMEKLEFLHIEKGIRKFSKSAIEYIRNRVGVFPSSKPDFETVEDRIEEVFRTSFTYDESNATKPVNLLDINFVGDDDEKLLIEEEPISFEIGR